jgi:hypothetical protein
MSDPVREQLVQLLRGGHAHVTFDDAVKNLPVKLRGARPPGSEHSAWEILEHIRIAQWDIVEFSRSAKHISPKWPDAYWPKTNKPTDSAWRKTVAAINKDREAMIKLIENPRTDLYAKIPHGTGQNILREAMLIADHNAYHIGELVLLRRILGAWK